MSSATFHLATFILGFLLLVSTLVNAELYVISPTQGSTCHGGQPCTVEWLDDGRAPLLTAVGVSTVGLYTGDRKLVQTIDPVDVSAVHSITFTPDPAAGPTSGAYYVALTSTQFKVNGTVPFAAYSPWFRLDGMTGSFDTPLSSATRTRPIPTSLTNRPTTTVLSTITVGRASPTASISSSAITSASSSSISSSASISRSTSSTLSSSSRMVTSVRPSTSATPLTTATSTGSSSSSASSSTPTTSNTSGALVPAIPLSFSLVVLSFLVCLAS